ncbi:MAG TPA: DUF1844 domain-containing protein [Terriglobales bacterium]|nr:DUF1844 domain-containing protein [Terriglobales bacterium]
MAPKKEQEFTITDRRRFAEDGEAHQAPPEPESEPVTIGSSAATAPRVEPQVEHPAESPVPPPPSDAEQQAQHEAFRESTASLDEELKAATGRPAQDFEMTFERFVASLYMTALMQMGLLKEQGMQPPPVDLLGARQTIDTLVLLRDKTKGNLTAAEENLLKNSLYEAQMAYVEVTNALTRAAQAPPAGSSAFPKK